MKFTNSFFFPTKISRRLNLTLQYKHTNTTHPHTADGVSLPGVWALLLDGQQLQQASATEDGAQSPLWAEI